MKKRLSHNVKKNLIKEAYQTAGYNNDNKDENKNEVRLLNRNQEIDMGDNKDEDDED